jgi:hypothetical protein
MSSMERVVNQAQTFMWLPPLPCCIISGNSMAFPDLQSEMKEAAESVQREISSLKDSAFNDLKGIADNVMTSTVGEALSGEETRSMLSVVGDVVGGSMEEWRARTSQHQVRSVAVFCVQRLAQHKSLFFEAVVVLQKALAKRQVLETHAEVLAVLQGEGELATNTNKVLQYSPDAIDTLGQDDQAVEKAVENELRQQQLEARDAFLAEEQGVADEISGRILALEAKRAAIENASDAVEKQELIAQCRMEQQTLTIMAKNVKNISHQLAIIVDFLADLNAHLTAIDGKLNMIQSQVSAVHEDLKRLVGRPVLEVLGEQADQRLYTAQHQLPSEVHIEPKVNRKGTPEQGKEEKFEPFGVNQGTGYRDPPEPISTACMAFLTGDKNVLLLSGQAGSGKSTAAERLELQIMGEFAKSYKQLNIVLLRLKLPNLRDPLGSIFDEGCKEIGLRQNQTDDLRTMIQDKDSKVRLVMIFDGYDELPPAILSKNLYRTNNLEQFRAVNASDAAWPKVVITCRKELLSKPQYEDAFLPIESKNEKKDEAGEAEQCFEEIRLVPYSNNRKPYQMQKAALLWRDEFVRDFPQLTYPPVHMDHEMTRKMLNEAKIATLVQMPELECDVSEQLQAVIVVSSLPSNASNEAINITESSLKDLIVKWILVLQPTSTDTNIKTGEKIKICIVAVLGALCCLDPEKDATSVKDFLHRAMNRSSENQLWTGHDFDNEFCKITELEVLTDTPFMVYIVTEILQRLVQGKAPRDVKNHLSLTLDEDTAERAWASLQKQRRCEQLDSEREVSLLEHLERIQRDLEKSRHSWGDLFLQMATEISPKNNTNQHLLIPRELEAALRRTPTSRSQIYNSFLQLWVEREAIKAAGQRGGVSSEAIRDLAIEFAMQLAVFLTCKNKVQLVKREHSSVFASVDAADIFFSDDLHVYAARSAAPLKRSDGCKLAFLHKTLQEHCAAELVLRGIPDAVRCTLLAPQELCNNARKLKDSSQGTKVERRQWAITQVELLETLANSALGKVFLEAESAVNDFIADRFISDVLLVLQLEAACTVLMARQCDALKQELRPEVQQVLGVVQENLIAILLHCRLDRRESKTLLCAARKAGADKLVDVLMKLVVGPFALLCTVLELSGDKELATLPAALVEKLPNLREFDLSSCRCLALLPEGHLCLSDATPTPDSCSGWSTYSLNVSVYASERSGPDTDLAALGRHW